MSLDLLELPLDGEHGHFQQRARRLGHVRFSHRNPDGPQIGTLTCHHVDGHLYDVLRRYSKQTSSASEGTLLVSETNERRDL